MLFIAFWAYNNITRGTLSAILAQRVSTLYHSCIIVATGSTVRKGSPLLAQWGKGRQDLRWHFQDWSSKRFRPRWRKCSHVTVQDSLEELVTTWPVIVPGLVVIRSAISPKRHPSLTSTSTSTSTEGSIVCDYSLASLGISIVANFGDQPSGTCVEHAQTRLLSPPTLLISPIKRMEYYKVKLGVH